MTPAETNDCGECGFSDESLGPVEVVAALRTFGRRYTAPLTRFLPGEDGDALLRQRPAPGVWSALEYAAHVRDVFAWYDERVRRSLTEDQPSVSGPDQDAAAEAGRYNELNPETVVAELAANAQKLADTFESLPAEAWDRVHLRRGQPRTVLFSARRAVHEGNHHLLDIGRGLRTVREQWKAAAASGPDA